MTEQIENIPTPSVNRIALLEGARGFLAAWVMVGHFIYFVAARDHATNPLVKILIAIFTSGNVAVALFMVLSGFVISHLILTRREPYYPYLARRFLRLFPAYFCCLLLGLITTFLASPVLSALPWSSNEWVMHQAQLAITHREYAIGHFITHLSMLHGLVPSFVLPDSTGALLGVGWSISTEWQFYIVAPLAIALTRTIVGWRVLATTVVICLLAFTKIGIAQPLRNEMAAMLGFHTQYFFIGGVSYWVWMRIGSWLDGLRRDDTCGFVSVAGVAAAILMFLDRGLALWCLLFACMAQLRAAPDSFEAKVVSAVGLSRFSFYLGKISYSLYLVHWPIGILTLRLLFPFLSLPYAIIAGLYIISASALSIVAAHLLYRFVEAPAIRWGKKKFVSINFSARQLPSSIGVS